MGEITVELLSLALFGFTSISLSRKEATKSAELFRRVIFSKRLIAFLR
jgi:hypothetical protein